MDNYSKTMLTIIAICLVWIAIRDTPVIREAEAQMVPTVQMIGGGSNHDRKYTTDYPGLKELQKDYYWLGGPIPVTIVDRKNPGTGE